LGGLIILALWAVAIHAGVVFVVDFVMIGALVDMAA
jgi:hypothetical protein